MWRLDRLPTDRLLSKYGVKLTSDDVAKLRHAPVRLLSAGSGGTGSFASPNGLILTNHDERSGRSIATDMRFALFIARDVHGAGWIVDELSASAR